MDELGCGCQGFHDADMVYDGDGTPRLIGEFVLEVPCAEHADEIAEDYAADRMMDR